MLVLDVAVVVGALLLLTKIGDLLLRPHQQRRLQTWFESATLRLSYSSMIAATRYVAMRRLWLIVLLLALLVPVQLSIAAPFVAAVLLQSVPGVTQERIAQAVGFIFITVLIATVPAAFALRWVVREQSGRKTAVRYVALLLCLIAATTVSGWLVAADVRLPSRLLMQFFDVMVIATGALFTALILVAWVFAFALMLHLLLRAIEAIAWRVVEYQRGAWAAVVAIATAVLGALDLYLKR
jgi:hypothetical protein